MINTLAETALCWDISGGVGSSCSSIAVMLTLFPAAPFPAQARNPSPHVWSNLLSPGRPHLPCQDPPLPQQLGPELLEPQVHPGKKITLHFLCVNNKMQTQFVAWWWAFQHHTDCCRREVFLILGFSLHKRVDYVGRALTAGDHTAQHIRRCASCSTFSPRVLKSWVIRTSAFLEPRTALTAAGESVFARNAFGAFWSVGVCCKS